MNKAILSSIRVLFSLASKIAPKITGRVAFRLFCTTFPVSNKSAQHQAILSRAKQQFTKAKHHTIPYSGGTSSPDSMSKIFDDFASMVGLNKTAIDALHNNVTRLSGRLTDDFNVSTQLQQVEADILLIHSPDDKEIPFSEAEAIARANESAILKPMNGLGHRRIIASDEVVSTSVAFIVNRKVG